ncbi:hypothetical protein TNCV_3979361 [Trichonephila clavipes]|nr:hypothetical protein TNCV_3979361 [Trichonephila clavipes]
MSDIGPFPGYFLDDKQYHSRARSVGDDRLNLLSSENEYACPVLFQSNCDAHDTIANGQYGAIWSMGYTQQVCVRIVLLPSNVWQQFFGRSAFLRQQETKFCHLLICGAHVPFADRTIISVFCRRRTSNMTSPCRLLHIPVVFK